MQRIGVDRLKRVIFYALPIVVLAVTIVLDLLTKSCFKDLYFKQGTTVFIKGLISITYVQNTGAAWSFLSGVSWAQTFFKILTVVALCLFTAMYLYAMKKGYKWLMYSIVFIVGGTIGNFVDRVAFGYVRDFILLTFMDFPVFNIADSFLCVGVVMFVIHYLFLDSDALFKKSSDNKDNNDKLNSKEQGEEAENAGQDL